MTPVAVLRELFGRLGATRGQSIIADAQTLLNWPDDVVAALKAQKILTKARPARSVVCPGCEQACAQPVYVVGDDAGASTAFVLCDRRSDINRVQVELANLEQWQASGANISKWLSAGLGLIATENRESDAGRWEIGVLKGAKHSAHVVLSADVSLTLTLNLAGHTLALADVINWKNGKIVIERRMLDRCTDKPVAGAGDAESAERREERLKTRVKEEKSKGTKAFLKKVADEEGITDSRLKQIVYRKRSADSKK